MNITILKGNLTRDPEVKFLPSGSQLTDFSIAVSEVWYNDSKEKQEKSHFFECVAFGNTAKTIGDFFKKGRPILIEGSLSQDTWEDKTTGQKKSRVKIKVNRFEFCGDNKPSAAGEAVKHPERQKPPVDPDLDADDDLPPF